jgi:membrane protein implicated in regulation of membrane protease activity
VSNRSETCHSSMLRATGWAGVVLAALAVLGLVYAPSLRWIWIAILVLAVTAVPQSLVAVRLQERREREQDRRRH